MLTRDGRFVPDERYRAATEKIIEDFLSEGRKPKSGRPRAVFTMGGPASGKGGLSGAHRPEGSVLIDSDEIKKRIPEYRALTKAGDARAATIAHEESSAIALASGGACRRVCRPGAEGCGGEAVARAPRAPSPPVVVTPLY